MQNENEPHLDADAASAGDVVEGEVIAETPPSLREASAAQAASLLGLAIKPSASRVPIGPREILAVILIVALCDLTIYRGHGMAGFALVFLAAPVLLLFGSYRPRVGLSCGIVSLMLVLLAGKMVWYGTPLLVAAGFALLVAFAACLTGRVPYVTTIVLFASQTIGAGLEGLVHYGRSTQVPVPRRRWLNVLLPVAALLLYGVIFVLANPNVVAFFSERAAILFENLRDWLLIFSPLEVGFWIAVAWLAVGLLRPWVNGSLFGTDAEQEPDEPDLPPVTSLFFSAWRNTLVAVIGLFAVYLVFEFATLWFRDFPEGFYYSGYAHEGAAWLTFALALATAMLSLIFRGEVLRDPRLNKLRWLAWIWSIQNLVLALAVYNRLLIYVDFNGMTRMRTVAFFGVTAVVVGFLLVLWKIHYNRDFTWLVRRHLWTLAIAVYLYAMTPVDALVTSYNVARILAGDPAPSVEISVHPISSEGVLLLRPLVESNNEIIRDGIAAMLAQRQEEAEAAATNRERQGWTAFQLADSVVLDGLRASSGTWREFTVDREKRGRALRRFHAYAYQWY